MIGSPANSGRRRTSTAAWNWSRSTCRIHRWVIGSSLERSSQSYAAELARHAFPRVAERIERLAALGQLTLHVIGVEQCEQGEGLGIEIAGRARIFQQDPNVAVVQHHWLVEAHLWIAVGIREQRVVGVDELQPIAAVGKEPVQRWRARSQWRRAEHEGPLFNLLVLVEQHNHQAGPAAEPAEQCALSHAGGRGDVVSGYRVGTALGDERASRVEEQRSVSRCIAPLWWSRIGYRQ